MIWILCPTALFSFSPLSGLRRLPREDLGHRWRPSAGDTARPRCRDLRHGRELWEHHDRCRILWQDHQSVVLTDVCAFGRAGGTRSLHHVTTGQEMIMLCEPNDHFWRICAVLVACAAIKCDYKHFLSPRTSVGELSTNFCCVLGSVLGGLPVILSCNVLLVVFAVFPSV